MNETDFKSLLIQVKQLSSKQLKILANVCYGERVLLTSKQLKIKEVK